MVPTVGTERAISDGCTWGSTRLRGDEQTSGSLRAKHRYRPSDISVTYGDAVHSAQAETSTADELTDSACGTFGNDAEF
jgi:hypothetical protein